MKKKQLQSRLVSINEREESKLFEAKVKKRVKNRKIARILFKVMQPIEIRAAQVRR
jgi:hypothetical protein